jgi:hypothetical protein
VDIPDLVGFNVYRTPSTNAFNKSKVVGTDTYYLINSSPVFFPSSFIPVYDDNDSSNPLNPGVTYKYVVTVVDCTGNESAPSQVLTAQPGKVDLDTGVNVTLSGSQSKQYNKVNFGFKNTSASTMTLRSTTDQAVVTWTNSNARLTKFVLDGTTLWQDASSTPSTVSGSTVTFTSSYTFAALTSGKTVTLTFKNSNGTTNLDMRGQTITIQPYYRNDTAYASYSSIPACFNNPAISLTTATGSSVSNTKQNPPVDGNNAPVTPKSSATAGVPPGYSVSATSPVTIEAVVTPQSGTSISSVTVNYYADSAFSSAAPDPSVVTYSSATMSSIGANTWQGTIPANNGNRIWFFVEAVDNKGNYSDDPSEASSTTFLAYTYEQKGTVTATYTASFVNPSGGDKHVAITGTATDEGGVVANGTVSYTIGSDSLSGTTDASGHFNITSTTNFTSGNVAMTVTVSKTGDASGTCTNTLPSTFSSITCP